MRTKMNNKLLLVPMVLGIISAVGGTTTTPYTTTTKPTTTTTQTTYTTTTAPQTTTTTTSAWTTGHSGLNLNGKMFTLSLYGGGISFYPPNFSPNQQSATSPYWTTPPSTRGVSVCVRYMTDSSVQGSSIFTLSPSRTPLKLRAQSINSFWLSYDTYGSMTQFFQPNIMFFPDLGFDIWTRVCVSVDFMKEVTQVFSGSYMSIRKMLPKKYVWSGEPVIQFSGFDGQVTNIQVWDYPLTYREVYSYMASAYTPYSGSVLTWSLISYSARGNVLLEDNYAWQEKQPISRQGRGRRLKHKKQPRRFSNMEENMESQGQQL